MQRWAEWPTSSGHHISVTAELYRRQRLSCEWLALHIVKWVRLKINYGWHRRRRAWVRFKPTWVGMVIPLSYSPRKNRWTYVANNAVLDHVTNAWHKFDQCATMGFAAFILSSLAVQNYQHLLFLQSVPYVGSLILLVKEVICVCVDVWQTLWKDPVSI